nr:MAG TPA: hypothetical protein [Caudoviricetes sp.]
MIKRFFKKLARITNSKNAFCNACIFSALVTMSTSLSELLGRSLVSIFSSAFMASSLINNSNISDRITKTFVVKRRR